MSTDKKKVDPHAKAKIFFGFKPNTKGYVVYDLQYHDISVSRNVIFL